MQVSRRFLMHDGHRLSYQLGGEGQPLVLVPGIMQSANRWREAGYLDALGDTFRMVVPDPLGHGASDKPHDPAAYSIANTTAHISAVMDAQGFERAVLWGYSRGGVIAAHFAAAHPGRVTALVLGGSAAILALDPTISPTPNVMTAPLASGDWDRVFAVLQITDDETKDTLRNGNDPIALAGALEGMFGTPPPSLAELRGHVFAYAGDAEPTFARATDSASRLGIAFAALEGHGHGGTFRESSLVIPLVTAFLGRMTH